MTGKPRPVVAHRAVMTQRMARWLKRWAFVALLVLSLVACDRKPTAAELEDLVIDVPRLMQARPERRDILPAQWSPALRALKPKRVYTNAEGLYIATSAFFVQERGIYVPRDAGKVSTDPGRDPSYRYLALGFYAYRMEG